MLKCLEILVRDCSFLAPEEKRTSARGSYCVPDCSFDGYILSYHERSYKPDREIYVAAERLTGLQGSQLCFIDDKVRLCEGDRGNGSWHEAVGATARAATARAAISI